MCAEYEIRTRKKQIEEALERRIVDKTGRDEWRERIKLSLRAPLLVQNGDVIEMIESVFPVRPFPNARLSGLETEAGETIKRIYERPTWGRAFCERRAIAPMTSFFEPAYWGTSAGEILRFEPPAGELFFVAAIQITARVPKVTNAHALLTHVASAQMREYHHRLIVILNARDALAWLDGSVADPVEKYDFLIEHRQGAELNVSPERKMAKGWLKRVEEHELARAAEARFEQALKKS